MKKTPPGHAPKTKQAPWAEESHVHVEDGALVERERLASLSLDVSMALTGGGQSNDSLERCAKALVRHLHVAFARIWTLNKKEEVLELQASAGMYTHLDGSHSRIPLGKYKIGLIAQDGQPHVTNAVIGDPRVHDQEWATREGMVAFAGYPLMVEGRVIGVMAVFSRTTLSEETLQTIAHVSTAVALGLAHREKDEELQQLQRQNERILHAAGQGIYGVDSEGLLTFLNPAAEKMIGWKAHEILGQDMHDVLHHTQLNGKPYPRVQCPIYTAFQDGQTNQSDSEVFWQKNGTAFSVEYRSTPMWDQGKLVGAVVTFSDVTERKRTETRLKAQQEQLRALAAEVARVEERERQRIAHGLHDDIGQTLATLKLTLGNLKAFPPQAVAAGCRKEALNLVDQAIQATRTLTFELGSPILYQLGLLAALESLGEQWQAQHPQIQVRVEVTTQPVSLENETAIVLFRVIRELLRNIEKHAQSRHVSIMVGKDNGHLSIIVEDDGRGFRPTQATGQHPSMGGFGLLSITEQVKSIGGHVEVETTLGQGTRTVVQAPLLVEEPENQRTNGKEQKPRSRTLRNS